MYGLQRKLESETINLRLENWGRWSRQPTTPQKYPTWGQIFKRFLGEPPSLSVAELDAQHLEEIITTLKLLGQAKWGYLNDLTAFILRVEFAERGDNYQRPVSERARDVSRHFQRRCRSSTYYSMLARAKHVISVLANPL